MGEIADMMLDGSLCEGCGVYLGATDLDCPCLCDNCARDRRDDGHAVERVGKVWVDSGPSMGGHPSKRVAKVRCPTCSRMVKAAGLKDHNNALHSGAAPRSAS